MGSLLRDVRQGLRSLRMSLGLTVVIITVLGIGIGANVAMFTLVDAAFLRPLRLPEPERLVEIPESLRSGSYVPVAYPNFADWQKRSQSFEMMGIVGVFPETLKKTGVKERIPAAYVSPGFHRAYGVKPAIGRLLADSDDRVGAEPAAVLAYGFWKSHFGGDADLIGRKLVLDEQVWTVIGVASPFQWDRSADVFLPISAAFSKWGLNSREQRANTGVIARLKRGVSLEQARSEMKLIAAQLAGEYPSANGGHSAVVIPLREYMGGSIRQPVLLMFGAVSMLLLIACANVAGLLLARAAVRQREIAIRIALGATRLQLVRQLLTESLLLASASTLAGCVLAGFSVSGLQRIFPAAQNLGGIGLDPRVLAFSVFAAALTAILFGLAPAIQFTRPDMTEAMKTGGRTAHGSALRMHTRKLLVVGQVALAVLLLVGAGLLMRSLLHVLGNDTGFRPEHVVAAQLLFPDRKDVDLARNARLLTNVTERLTSLPGVQVTGAIDDLPFNNEESWAEFYRDDRPLPAPGHLPNAMKATATPGYFAAMGIPLLKGRLFTASDGRMPSLRRDIPTVLAYLRSTDLVAVVNESMARKYWPGEDPLGKVFRFGPPSLKGPRVRIVGVVGDARQLGLDHSAEPQYFFSADQFPILEARLVLRTTGGVSALTAALRKVVAESEPDAVVPKVESMETLVSRSVATRQNNVLLLGAFSALALLLAAIGLYATMAYIVAQRTQEIGVRLALGAAARDIRTLVVREGAMLAIAGIGIGIGTALLGARLVSAMLYGVTTTDALTYTASAVVLLLIMLAASYVPAWRASRVDPMAALHSE